MLPSVSFVMADEEFFLLFHKCVKRSLDALKSYENLLISFPVTAVTRSWDHLHVIGMSLKFLWM